MFVNLISCDECGVVYDKEKLNFEFRRHDDESIDDAYVRWNCRDDEWQPYVACRICRATVFKGSQ